MFVHLTIHFINKPGEEDPENSPVVVFAPPFSFCLCGFFVCVVCGIFFLRSIHLSFLNVLFTLEAEQRVLYIFLPMGNEEASGTKSYVVGWVVPFGGIWLPSSTYAFPFTCWEVASGQREGREDVSLWGEALSGVGGTLIMHFYEGNQQCLLLVGEPMKPGCHKQRRRIWKGLCRFRAWKKQGQSWYWKCRLWIGTV